MAPKIGKISVPTTAKAKLFGHSYTCGATGGKLAWNLTTDDLGKKGQSDPPKNLCTIVDGLRANYDVFSFIQLSSVKNKLKSAKTLKAIQKEKDASKILKLLGLEGLLELADASELGAQPWVRGHLLPDSLGGPNAIWNITPIDKHANSKMYHDFEKKVYGDLEKAAKIEQKLSHRVVVRYQVELQGSMKPWWRPATGHVTYVLSKLPNRIVAKTEIAGFVSKKGDDKPIGDDQKKLFNGMFKYSFSKRTDGR